MIKRILPQRRKGFNYLQQMKQVQKKGESRVAESVSVVAMAIATFAVAINQILFTRHIKAVYVEVLQLQQQLRRLEKQLE